MSEVDDITARLRALAPKELESVNAHLQALRTLGAGPRGQAPFSMAPASEDEEYLYRSLCSELTKDLGTKFAPYHVFRTLKFYEKFSAAARAVLDTNAAWLPKQTKLEKLSMLSLYAEIVVGYMRRHGWTLFWPSVIKALEMFPAIVEHAFPSYIRNGTLSIVMQKRTMEKGNGTPADH